MQSASRLALSRPPLPPPLRTDSRVVEPDEQWKADLRERIERDLRHMVEEAQTVRDAILNSQPPESSRERAQREFEESMNNIRSLAQEQFNSQLRLEMTERKWALDLVDSSNSPEVVRQQQWILDNIHKTDEPAPFSPQDAPQSSEGGLSIIPRQQGDSEQGSPERWQQHWIFDNIQQGNSERGFDDSFEEGHENGGIGDEGDRSDESTEEVGEEEGEEERGERDTNPRQSRPSSRSSTPLFRGTHSWFPVSREDFQLWLHRQPLNLQPGEDNDNEDIEDSQEHSVLRHGGQPSPLGAARRQSSSSQASIWRTASRAQEPSGISRIAKEHMYSLGFIQSPRRGSVNSTGSTSSGTGLHRAGSINDQYRSSSAAPHSGAGPPPFENHDRVASPIVPSERAISAPASPRNRRRLLSHPKTSPLTIPRPPPLDDAVRIPWSASPSSRAIYNMQRSREDIRQGIATSSGPATPEGGSRGTSWGSSSLNSHRSFSEFIAHRRHNSKGDPRLPRADGDLSDASDDVVGLHDDRHSVRSLRSVSSVRSMELEQRAVRLEAEARRKEEEAYRKEEAASRKEEEAHRKEEEAQRKEEEARRREEVVRRKEEDVLKREDDARRREEDARQREMLARQKEEEARRKEDEAKRKEAEARRRKKEARRIEEDHERKKREAESQMREAEVFAQEIGAQRERARQSLEEAERLGGTRQAEVLDAQKKEAKAKKREADTLMRETTVKRKEEEVIRREDEAYHLEEKARQALESARQKEVEAVRREEAAKKREAEVQRREAEAHRKDEELSQREKQAHLEKAETRKFEERLQNIERHIQGREAKIEQMLRTIEESNRAINLREDDLQQKLASVRKQEEKLKLREAELQEMEAETNSYGYSADISETTTNFFGLVRARSSYEHIRVKGPTSAQGT